MTWKNNVLLLQLLGVVILLAGFRGFFVLESRIAYFIGVLVGVVGFAVLLSKGGALAKKGGN